MSADRSIQIATGATVLTIAGSDPSGGAGLQADLKVFQQLGCYGMSAVTLVTVQNAKGVKKVESLSTDVVIEQIEAAISDIEPRVIKTGALGSAETIEAVSKKLRELRLPLIVDPVLVSKNGDNLADKDAVSAYVEHLLPIATVLTPNHFEAEKLIGEELTELQDRVDAAAGLQKLGPSYVVLKTNTDDNNHHNIIASDEKVVGFELPTLDSEKTHGAGCALSAAIAARLALTLGDSVDDQIVRSAIEFATASVHNAIKLGPDLNTGVGPIETRVMHIGN